MTLRHMKIFLSVCENGSNTTKAAAALHTTQPAVSLAIKELEQYYGVALFERIGKRLRITEAGKRLLEYASGSFITAINICRRLPGVFWTCAGITKRRTRIPLTCYREALNNEVSAGSRRFWHRRKF